MVRSVVITGAAGFIGSHLAQACLDRGDRVLGIDLLTDYYDTRQKQANLATLKSNPNFELVVADVADVCDELLSGIDVIFHQAGQPGVRASWQHQFDTYIERNVVATQRLLEAARKHRTPRFVYASSSSVYGNATSYPVTETSVPRPFSPYGVTKLAAEHLCSLYAENFAVPVVSLRYFTVYGSRQRPDMATHRLIESALTTAPFTMFGSADKIREFTHVSDVVQANIAAAGSDVPPGLVVNITGGAECSMRALIEMVATEVGTPPVIVQEGAQDGDVTKTSGCIAEAERHLGWHPDTSLDVGIREQVRWHRDRSSVAQ